jgi:hypothetical protein
VRTVSEQFLLPLDSTALPAIICRVRRIKRAMIASAQRERAARIANGAGGPTLGGHEWGAIATECARQNRLRAQLAEAYRRLLDCATEEQALAVIRGEQ